MLNRRELIKRGGFTAGVLAIAGPGILISTGCGDTKQLVRWTVMLIGALKDVSLILGDMGQGNIVALIGRAIPIAEKLKKAFEDNDHASTLTFIDNLINPTSGIIVEIANAVGALADEGRKRIVLGTLAIGMVALRLISANIENETPVAAADTARRRAPVASRSVKKAAESSALEKAFAAVRF